MQSTLCCLFSKSRATAIPKPAEIAADEYVAPNESTLLLRSFVPPKDCERAPRGQFSPGIESTQDYFADRLDLQFPILGDHAVYRRYS